MPLQVTFTNPFFKRMMFSTRVNSRVELATQDLLERRNANESMFLVSNETKQLILSSPFAMKLSKLRNSGNPSTKYNLDVLDFSVADYKLLKRYTSSARIRVPLKVQNTISLVLNNITSEYLSALHAATHTQKLATLAVLNDENLQATLLGGRFDSVAAYRAARKTQMAYPPTDEHTVAMDHIKSTLQRAYKHTHDAHTARGAKMDDALLHIIAHSLCVIIHRYADALTHMNSASPNKTIRNGDVHRLFEVDGLINGCTFVAHFQQQVKACDAEVATPPGSPVPKDPVADVAAVPVELVAVAAVAAAAEPAAEPAADAPPADKKRRKSVKK
jgi:hypothetical protein